MSAPAVSMMVGDAEDRRRWARVHTLTDAARRAESRAVDPRTPDRSRRPLLERAAELRRRAYYLTV